MGHAALVLIRRGCAARIFRDHQVKAQLPGVTGGGFHTDIGGDPAQNNRVDPATAQLELQVGAVECAPLAFGNFYIAVAFTERDRICPPVVRQRLRRGLGINRLF